MNINITTFTHPFSFFCKIQSDDECLNVLETDIDDSRNYHQFQKSRVSDFNHGQVSYEFIDYLTIATDIKLKRTTRSNYRT